MKSVRTALSALLLLTSWTAQAADPVTEAISQAYVPYRVALFQTNMKAQKESEQAMAQAQQAWQSLTERFAMKPTLPYEGDPAFRTTLQEVGKVYDQAAGEIRLQKLAQAHETLEKVRDLLAGLRQRNGVVVFSDHMNAYHEAMEHLLNDGAAMTASPQGMLTLVERVGVLAYLAGRLRSEAPKSMLGNPDFTTALEALEASVAQLRQAALKQDATAARDALSQIKRPYSRMFIKFG